MSGEQWHGTWSGYTNHRCRCEDCGRARREYMAAKRRLHIREPLAPDDPRHGTANAYDYWSCRCTPCRAVAVAAATARLRAKERQS